MRRKKVDKERKIKKEGRGRVGGGTKKLGRKRKGEGGGEGRRGKIEWGRIGQPPPPTAFCVLIRLFRY